MREEVVSWGLDEAIRGYLPDELVKKRGLVLSVPAKDDGVYKVVLRASDGTECATKVSDVVVSCGGQQYIRSVAKFLVEGLGEEGMG